MSQHPPDPLGTPAQPPAFDQPGAAPAAAPGGAGVLRRWATTYLARRLGQTVVVVVGATLLTFSMVHIMPGDPVVAILGEDAEIAAREALREELGLNQPIWAHFVDFSTGILRGDLGRSFIYRQPVFTLVTDRLKVSMVLLAYTGVLTLLLSVPLALLAATRQNSLWDDGARMLSVLGLGLPSFWFGLVLMLVFSLRLGWFPIGGFGRTFWQQVHSLFLPSLTLSMVILPQLLRSLRSSLLTVLESDYTLAARSRGFRERRVLVRHVLPNAAPGPMTVFAVNLGALVGVTVVIETVFALPGLGMLLVQSAISRDFPVIQGIALLLAFIVTGIYLVTDLLYTVVDPRIRL